MRVMTHAWLLVSLPLVAPCGILIPPSVMIIVYAAVAGQSVVKLYAAAMFPGFFLAFLYLVYVIGWVLIDPKVAPKLPEEKLRAPVSPWLQALGQQYSPRILPALVSAVLSPQRALQIQVSQLRVHVVAASQKLGS